MSLLNCFLFFITLIAPFVLDLSIASAADYSITYTFKDSTDGNEPTGLSVINGNLLGVTQAGGVPSGGGTIFKVTPSGKKSFVYKFPAQVPPYATPYRPISGVILVDGSLFGTTYYGGAYQFGTIYKISARNTVSIIYSFDQSQPGLFYSNAVGQLTSIGDTIYGVVNGLNYNGTFPLCATQPGCGDAYSMTTSGNETILTNFNNLGKTADPVTGLSNISGTLYGVNCLGGNSFGSADNAGAGSVYKILPNNGGAINIYEFAPYPIPSDGSCPNSPPISVNGTLYGTTGTGGAYGFGTVYAISPSGQESIVYSFKGGTADGSDPTSLIYLNGTLYGTTQGGGFSSCYAMTQCGTIFSLTLKGSETVIHFFSGGTDGATPTGPLAVLGKALYGTTLFGGNTECNDFGCGTVFSVKP